MGNHVAAVVHGDGLVVLCILEDVDVLAANAVQKLGFELTVGKPSEAGVHLEVGRPVLVDGTADTQV